MKKRYYAIAGLLVEITYESGDGLGQLQRFEVDECPSHTDIKVVLKKETGVFSECFGILHYRAGEKKSNVFLSKKYTNIRMVADESYENAVIEGCGACKQEGVMELLLIDVYSFLARRKWLLMHASCIEYQGKGLIFIGESGIGKTTQARLWARHLGAEILNGDKVFLAQEDVSGIRAWGSPWRGSSPYALNRSVPLLAVVVLKKSEINQIRPLEGLEKLQCLSANVFYPFWDKGCLNSSLETMDKLGRLPVYLLSCRPDEEAVQTANKMIFR